MSRIVKSRLTLVTGFFGILLSLLASFWFPLGIAGALLALLALVSQYRSAGAEVFEIAASDWMQVGSEYVFDAQYPQHGRRKPQVTTSHLTGANQYEQVICDVRVNSQGDVRVAAGKPFIGRIEIT